MGLFTNNKPENPLYVCVCVCVCVFLIINANKNLLYETLERVGGGAIVTSLRKGDTILWRVLKSASR